MNTREFYKWFTDFCYEKGWYTDGEDHLLNDCPQEVQDYHINLIFELFALFLCSAPLEEKEKMNSTFVEIDFHGANCRAYLRNLINGFMSFMNKELPYDNAGNPKEKLY